MEIGTQIKALRLRKGVTQETLAQKLGVTAQAVSKWERGTGAPDIGMLPEISAYFGTTIDELFALTPEMRMERIENAIEDVRFCDPADTESARQFLTEQVRTHPDDGKPHSLLAALENHLADEHKEMARDYALEALRREPTSWDPMNQLNHAMNGKFQDWNYTNHCRLITHCKALVRENPQNWRAIMLLLDQLIDDYRLEEAKSYWEAWSKFDSTYRIPLYQGMLAWQSGNREEAFDIWEKMKWDFPRDWCFWHHVGDFYAKTGRWEEAIVHYRKALDVQPSPKMLDPLEAISQAMEICGNYAGAIAALNEEIELAAMDWDITEGEFVDRIRREITRLERAATVG